MPLLILSHQWAFSGISTFAHLKHVKCLSEPNHPYDIGVIGVPFDTAVSYRPGARFGPRAIRAASARQLPFRAFNPRRGLNPYGGQYTILDCGDVPVMPFDNGLALQQMTEAFLELGARAPATTHPSFPHPKILSLGGDHSIALPALRALHRIYGQPIAVLHFDAHLDTWHPAKYPSAWNSAQSEFTHGSMFWIASNEGGLSATSCLSTTACTLSFIQRGDALPALPTRLAIQHMDNSICISFVPPSSVPTLYMLTGQRCYTSMFPKFNPPTCY